MQYKKNQENKPEQTSYKSIRKLSKRLYQNKSPGQDDFTKDIPNF